MLFYIDVLVDIWFIFDIYLTFNTAYFLRTRDLLITDKYKVRLNYLQGYFIVDLLAVFPFEPLAALFSVNGNKALESFSVLKLFKLSRMMRVIRIAKVTKLCTDLEDKYNLDIGVVRSFGTIISSLSYMLLMIHFSACITFIVTNTWCYGYKPGEENQIADGFSWIELSNVADKPPEFQYRLIIKPNLNLLIFVYTNVVIKFFLSLVNVPLHVPFSSYWIRYRNSRMYCRCIRDFGITAHRLYHVCSGDRVFRIIS